MVNGRIFQRIIDGLIRRVVSRFIARKAPRCQRLRLVGGICTGNIPGCGIGLEGVSFSCHGLLVLLAEFGIDIAQMLDDRFVAVLLRLRQVCSRGNKTLKRIGQLSRSPWALSSFLSELSLSPLSALHLKQISGLLYPDRKWTSYPATSSRDCPRNSLILRMISPIFAIFRIAREMDNLSAKGQPKRKMVRGTGFEPVTPTVSV